MAPEVANVAAMDGGGAMTEVVIGKLLQMFQFGVNGGSAGEVGIENDLLGVHRWLGDVIDDATMNTPFNPQAKPIRKKKSTSIGSLP